uniref:Uncharacterized protein n=1 Tax=Megaselia scalaris TaxID=36166 RepID=T1H1F5_MEGSC
MLVHMAYRLNFSRPQAPGMGTVCNFRNLQVIIILDEMPNSLISLKFLFSYIVRLPKVQNNLHGDHCKA